MIRELTELAERNRKKEKGAGKIVHNAIKKEKVNFFLFIDKNGKFISFQGLKEPKLSDCEALSSKKGKARLLVDKLEETLGLDFFDSSAKDRNELYLNKLENFRQIEQLEPIFRFYTEAHGLESAKTAILNEIKSDIQKEIDEINKSDKKNKKPVEIAANEKVEKKYEGNIAFYIGEKLINEDENVISAIIDKYEESQSSFTKKVCSVCGKEKYPVEDIPHGMLSNVPEGLNGRGAFISFNENAFESYNLKGNLNCQICNNCFPAYTEALNWLLAPSGIIKDQKGKDRSYFNNRFDFGKDTATVFWTKKETTFNVKKF
ncbi:MAG: type I-C CRISPR-associated protein Cas8c/Csd1 [Leptospiraceae bacterium]|nr:type I-C CRISPR-associated protein Cas8c/Csd1 [Leptospiraceae bacterium]